MPIPILRIDVYSACSSLQHTLGHQSGKADGEGLFRTLRENGKQIACRNYRLSTCSSFSRVLIASALLIQAPIRYQYRFLPCANVADCRAKRGFRTSAGSGKRDLC